MMVARIRVADYGTRADALAAVKEVTDRIHASGGTCSIYEIRNRRGIVYMFRVDQD